MAVNHPFSLITLGDKWSFNNYVDGILPFFVPPPLCVDSFYTLSMDKKRHSKARWQSAVQSLSSCDMFASNSIFTLVSWLQNQHANNSRYVIQRGANLDDCLTNQPLM